MLRRRDGTEGSEAAAVVGLSRVSVAPAPRVVTGRPLRPARGGTLEPGAPVDVQLVDGWIAAVRPASRAGAARDGGPDAILAPALADPHLHLAATASARIRPDLSREHPGDLRRLAERVRRWAGDRDEELTVRGFDEFRLAERRWPTLEELDAMAPGRPLRLRHATLHASALNGDARRRLPPELASQVGADGLLVGREEALSALFRDRAAGSLSRGFAQLGRELAQAGIAWVDDVTASNDAARIELLADAVEAGWIRQRVRVWLRDASELVPARVAARGRLEVAGVKLLPRSDDDARRPEFRGAVVRAREAGTSIAIHAVEPDVIAAALDALEAAPPRRGGVGPPDRLEHCSLCPPELVGRIAAAGVAVVTQPGFLVSRGAKYREEVEEPLWPWLYPIGSLRRAGALVAASSDSPVIAADPRLGFVGAIARGSDDGAAFGPDEGVTEAAALELYTSSAAALRGARRPSPWLAPGAPADLVLLEGPDVRAWAPQKAWIAGECVLGSAS